MKQKLGLKMAIGFMIGVSLMGCEAKEEDASTYTQIEHSTSQDQPSIQEAINQVIESEEVMGVMELDEESAYDLVGLDVSTLDESYLYYGMGRFGIIDIFVVKPKADEIPQVIEIFKAHQENRMMTFEQYNVDGDYDKAKQAEIYEQKGYVILIIASDATLAKEVINQSLK